MPMVEGPGTQGFVVYRGPATPNFFWFCDVVGGNYSSVGEVAEEVHLLQAGDLASITFAYHVQGSGSISSGLADAVIRVYANGPTDALTPPAGLLASYTMTGLPWSTATNHTATFDIPVPFPVGADLWIGIEMVSPAGTAGSVLGAASPWSPPQSPVPAIGASHNLTYFGPACPPSGVFDNAAAFGLVLNYTILVRIFPPLACDYPIANGDFESGTLASWSGAGRRGVLSADLIPVAGNTFYTVPPSGAYQGFVSNGGVYTGTGSAVGTVALESALGVPSGTLLALGGGAATQGSCLTQVLNVLPGDTLEFKWNFQTNEPTPSATRNDFAFLTISTNGAILLADTFYPSFVPSPSPFSEETGYQNYAHTFTSAATVTVGFGVADRGTSTTSDSALLIDCVELVPGSPANTPPACSADLTLAQLDFLEVAPGAFVVTEGETLVVPFEGTDADGDFLQVSTAGFPAGASIAPLSGNAPLASTLTWTPSAADKSGAPHTFLVTFGDPSGASSTCEVTVADVNLRPECSASSQTVECTSHAGALVTLDGAAFDPDDPPASLAYQWFVSDASVVLDDPSSPTPTGLFPIGITMATLTVADGRGGVAVCDVSITVEDTTPPELLCTTDRAALWPPKHAMVPVTLAIVATDACVDPDEILPIVVLVSSSEPDDAMGGGDGQTSGDVAGSDGHAAPVDVTGDFSFDPSSGTWTGTVLLRAERAGAGVGRKYTIDVQAFDSHGNAAVTSCCVVVPHDQRAKP
ncbi:MAG TPA: hypothetical protein VF530_05125 [Planctomycetota bacterium]